MRIILFQLLYFQVNFIFCTISPEFRSFIQQRFNNQVASILARDDLGTDGSFGGGNQQIGGLMTMFILFLWF